MSSDSRVFDLLATNCGWKSVYSSMATFDRYLRLIGAQDMHRRFVNIAAILVLLAACAGSDSGLPPDATLLQDVDSAQFGAFCEYGDSLYERAAIDLGMLDAPPLFPPGTEQRELPCPAGASVEVHVQYACRPEQVDFTRVGSDCTATVAEWRECIVEQANAMCSDHGTLANPIPSCERLRERCPGY